MQQGNAETAETPFSFSKSRLRSVALTLLGSSLSACCLLYSSYIIIIIVFREQKKRSHLLCEARGGLYGLGHSVPRTQRTVSMMTAHAHTSNTTHDNTRHTDPSIDQTHRISLSSAHVSHWTQPLSRSRAAWARLAGWLPSLATGNAACTWPSIIITSAGAPWRSSIYAPVGRSSLRRTVIVCRRQGRGGQWRSYGHFREPTWIPGQDVPL